MCHHKVIVYACKHVRIEVELCPSMAPGNQFPHFVSTGHTDDVSRSSSNCEDCRKVQLLRRERREAEQPLERSNGLALNPPKSRESTLGQAARTIPQKPLPTSAGHLRSASTLSRGRKGLPTSRLISPAAQQHAELSFGHSVSAPLPQGGDVFTSRQLSRVPEETTGPTTQTRRHPSSLIPGRTSNAFVKSSVAQVPAHYEVIWRANVSPAEEDTDEKAEDSPKEVQAWERGNQEIKPLNIVTGSPKDTSTTSVDEERAGVGSAQGPEQNTAQNPLPHFIWENNYLPEALVPAWPTSLSSHYHHSMPITEKSEVSHEIPVSSQEDSPPQLPHLQQLPPLPLGDVSCDEMMTIFKNW